MSRAYVDGRARRLPLRCIRANVPHVTTTTQLTSFARTASAWSARIDPRWFQIACLSGLLVWGIFGLSFDVVPTHMVAIVVVAQLAQAGFTRLFRAGAWDPKSALISSLSLCLLLRTSSVVVAAAVAFVAVASKFVVRVRGKHVLNPTNGALVLALLVDAPVWVSPGQWGNVTFFAFLMVCLGMLTVTRSSRVDVVVAFLVAWCALVVGRSLWLGEPMTIPAHRLQSGALLLFAFFMISDPKTTPDARVARVVFAVVVAVGAWYVQFRLFRTNGLLWSLFLCSLFVPLFDRVAAGPRFTWRPVSSSSPLSSSSSSSSSLSASLPLEVR